MGSHSGLSLIRLFNFYLAAVFLVGLVVRIQQYRVVLGLVRSFQGRWPKLFKLIKEHSVVLLTWRTLLPGVLTFALFAIHLVASQFLWPRAKLTLSQLALLWPALLIVALFGLAMVGIDVFLLCITSKIDRPVLEKYFDQAEYWLRSWTAPVVQFLSLGYISPRRMVSAEVRKALTKATGMVNATLWWVALQTALRIAFGLSLWISFGLERWYFPNSAVDTAGTGLCIAFALFVPLK